MAKFGVYSRGIAGRGKGKLYGYFATDVEAVSIKDWLKTQDNSVVFYTEEVPEPTLSTVDDFKAKYTLDKGKNDRISNFQAEIEKMAAERLAAGLMTQEDYNKILHKRKSKETVATPTTPAVTPPAVVVATENTATTVVKTPDESPVFSEAELAELNG